MTLEGSREKVMRVLARAAWRVGWSGDEVECPYLPKHVPALYQTRHPGTTDVAVECSIRSRWLYIRHICNE